jgi:heparan-alpha-glucosaminide N-acetyltransferase
MRPTAAPAVAPPPRLFSLDVYRGLVMILLASAGFGIMELVKLPDTAKVWQYLDFSTWQPRLAYNFQHTVWQSNFDWIGVSLWDLIQPAFMFIVGAAMPFSYARRAAAGEGPVARFIHALFRALVLVLLGVFLSSVGEAETNWTFVNVLSQIGLGYLFVFLIMSIGRRFFWLQLVFFVLILAGYWGWFYASPAPAAGYDFAKVGASGEEIFEGAFAPWSKNANVAHDVDVWFLNQFSRPVNKPFNFNEGGYQTLNFIPAIGTMLLGVFCGQLLMSSRQWWQKLLWLAIGGGVCLGLGVLAGEYACPIVKRIWTPSWVLFSGAWVIWGLAVCYLLFDLCRLRWIGWPFVVVGVNSLAFYLMAQLIPSWAAKTMQTHFGILLAWADEKWLGPGALAPDMFGWLVPSVLTLIFFWLVALWLYSKKYFVRI